MLTLAGGQHHQGLACAARSTSSLSAPCRSRMIKLDFAYNLVRQVSSTSIELFKSEVHAYLRGLGNRRAKNRHRSKHGQHESYDIPSARSDSSGDDEGGGAGIGVQKDESTTSLPKAEGAYNLEGTQTYDTEPMLYDLILAILHELQYMVVETRAHVLSLGTSSQGQTTCAG